MPSKIQQDENLYFLSACIKHSDLKIIDFAAVAGCTNIKAPAARMRYTRLKKQIEANPPVGMGVEKGVKDGAVVRGGGLERGMMLQGGDDGKKRKRRREEGCEGEDPRFYQRYDVGYQQPHLRALPSGSSVPYFDQDLYPQSHAPPSFERNPQHAWAKAPIFDQATFPETYSRDPTVKAQKSIDTPHSPGRVAASTRREEDGSESEDEIPLAKLHRKEKSSLHLSHVSSSTSQGYPMSHPRHQLVSKPPSSDTSLYIQKQEQGQLRGNFTSRERPNPLFSNPNPFSSSYPPNHVASHPQSHVSRDFEDHRSTHSTTHRSHFRFPSQK